MPAGGGEVALPTLYTMVKGNGRILELAHGRRRHQLPVRVLAFRMNVAPVAERLDAPGAPLQAAADFAKETVLAFAVSSSLFSVRRPSCSDATAGSSKRAARTPR
jgi:hypothetical protein